MNMSRKRKADLILLAVALCFVAASIALYQHPAWWTRLLFYMTEAGLVGGLADWYAVTALFRHPLGIRSKHTAIIPRNRAKLIDGVVAMVETQLLPPDKLKEKLAEARIMSTAIEWLDERFQNGTIADAGWKKLVSVLRNFDFTRVSGEWELTLKKLLQRTDVTPYAGKAIHSVLEHGDIHILLDKLIDAIAKRTSTPETKAFILLMLQNEHDKQLNAGNAFTRFLKKAASIFAEESNALNLEDAAEVLHRDLIQLLSDLKQHDHEIRLLLISSLRDLADNLAQNNDMAESIHTWKNELLDRISLTPSIEALLAALKKLPLDIPPVPVKQEQAADELSAHVDHAPESQIETARLDDLLSEAIDEDKAETDTLAINETTQRKKVQPADYDETEPIAAQQAAAARERVTRTAAADGAQETATPVSSANDAPGTANTASAADALERITPASGSDNVFESTFLTPASNDAFETAPPTPASDDALVGLRREFGRLIENYWEQFKQDQSKQDWIEGYLKQFLSKIIDTEHRLIGQTVRDTLDEFTEERLIAFIEDKVGEDLSRIRINGSLVGAGIGALLFLLLHGVYDPILRTMGH